MNACVTSKEACSVTSVTGSKNCVNVTGEELYTGNQDCFISCKEDNLRTLSVNSSVANHVHFVFGLPQKKGVIPNYCHLYPEIKHVKGVSCVNQSSSVQNVTNVPTVVTNLRVRGQITPVLGKMDSTRHQPQSISSPHGRVHITLLVPAKSDKISHNNKLLCESPQEQLPVGGFASAVRQMCCRIGSKSTVPGVLQLAIFGTQTQQPVETYLGSQQTQHLFENTVIQNGDRGDNKDLPPDRGVGNLHRLQGRILPYTNKQTVQEIHAFSYPGRDLSIQSTTL